MLYKTEMDAAPKVYLQVLHMLNCTLSKGLWPVDIFNVEETYYGYWDWTKYHAVINFHIVNLKNIAWYKE